MAEVHVIGHIVGASGFPRSSLYCKWALHSGSAWKVLEGQIEGQTQVDDPTIGDTSNWCHPIDVHYVTKGVQGWPKLHVQVWHLDRFSRSEIFGYGVCHIPTTPGTSHIDCVTWRPIGSYSERLSQAFVGGGRQLCDIGVALDGADRHCLRTQSMGTVHLELGVVVKNFNTYGVQL